MQPIGIFGGTFDPIHIGHLRTAYELLNHFDLAQIRFVPCRSPPHQKSPYASTDLRLAMLRGAVAGSGNFIVDDREFHREGISYSVDTLESFRTEFPERSLGLIVGMDAFLEFETWHRWQDILRLAHLIVARRPGTGASEPVESGKLLARYGAEDPSVLQQETAGRIFVHAVTQLEISSSAIRESVAVGGKPQFLVPEIVAEIIEESGCYAGNNE
jgi:nicotinate-nucleotide adenylyltransferase